MKKIITALLLAGSASAFAFGTYTGEESGGGLTKICYYSTPQGKVAITVKSYQVCPPSIN